MEVNGMSPRFLKYMKCPLDMLSAIYCFGFKSMWGVGFRAKERDYEYSNYKESWSGMISEIPLGMVSAIPLDLLSAIRVDLYSAILPNLGHSGKVHEWLFSAYLVMLGDKDDSEEAHIFWVNVGFTSA
jgi:hypothetical protein